MQSYLGATDAPILLQNEITQDDFIQSHLEATDASIILLQK